VLSSRPRSSNSISRPAAPSGRAPFSIGQLSEYLFIAVWLVAARSMVLTIILARGKRPAVPTLRHPSPPTTRKQVAQPPSRGLLVGDKCALTITMKAHNSEHRDCAKGDWQEGDMEEDGVTSGAGPFPLLH